MKARIERAWIRARESHGIVEYEVVVRIDVRKGKFIESVHRTPENAHARVEELLRGDESARGEILVDLKDLTPTV